jgi:hypothetical protein
MLGLELKLERMLGLELELERMLGLEQGLALELVPIELVVVLQLLLHQLGPGARLAGLGLGQLGLGYWLVFGLGLGLGIALELGLGVGQEVGEQKAERVLGAAALTNLQALGSVAHLLVSLLRAGLLAPPLTPLVPSPLIHPPHAPLLLSHLSLVLYSHPLSSWSLLLFVSMHLCEHFLRSLLLLLPHYRLLPLAPLHHAHFAQVCPAHLLLFPASPQPPSPPPPLPYLSQQLLPLSWLFPVLL